MRLDAQYTHTARSMTRSAARELMGAAILMGNTLIIERRRLASARAAPRQCLPISEPIRCGACIPPRASACAKWLRRDEPPRRPSAARAVLPASWGLLTPRVHE